MSDVPEWKQALLKRKRDRAAQQEQHGAGGESSSSAKFEAAPRTHLSQSASAIAVRASAATSSGGVADLKRKFGQKSPASIAVRASAAMAVGADGPAGRRKAPAAFHERTSSGRKGSVSSAGSDWLQHQDARVIGTSQSQQKAASAISPPSASESQSGSGATTATTSGNFASDATALMSGTEDPLRDAFTAFFEANEVLPVLDAFEKFKVACVERVGGAGEAAKFGSLLELLAAAADNSGLSFRMKKVISDLIPVARKRKVGFAMKNPDLKVVVSGAGPVGLHTALDLSMLGFRNVTVVEKRSTFSRHNILTMWIATAEHMMTYNCREFFPLFSHRDKVPHLGTRELQLTLLKCGLLLGVQFEYGQETVALEAPSEDGEPWNVGLRKPTGRVEPTGVLDLKAGKFEDAVQRVADGAVGMTEVYT